MTAPFPYKAVFVDTILSLPWWIWHCASIRCQIRFWSPPNVAPLFLLLFCSQKWSFKSLPMETNYQTIGVFRRPDVSLIFVEEIYRRTREFRFYTSQSYFPWEIQESLRVSVCLWNLIWGKESRFSRVFIFYMGQALGSDLRFGRINFATRHIHNTSLGIPLVYNCQRRYRSGRLW